MQGGYIYAGLYHATGFSFLPPFFSAVSVPLSHCSIENLTRFVPTWLFETTLTRYRRQRNRGPSNAEEHFQRTPFYKVWRTVHVYRSSGVLRVALTHSTMCRSMHPRKTCRDSCLSSASRCRSARCCARTPLAPCCVPRACVCTYSAQGSPVLERDGFTGASPGPHYERPVLLSDGTARG